MQICSTRLDGLRLQLEEKMSSQTDLDQGGTNRQWVLADMGPTLGRVRVPLQNVLVITVAGTYVLNASTTLVQVNCNGAVVIKLPTAIQPSYQGAPSAQPGNFANSPITIVDVGGFAASHPITIDPASVAETIMDLTSIQIQVAYGGYTLLPNSAEATWNSISP